MPTSRHAVRSISFTLVSLALFCLVSSGFADSSSLVTYQGSLKENGALVTGQHTFEFRLTNQTGSSVYWTSGPITVEVIDGLYKVLLDVDANALNQGDAYMETWVNGSMLTPREPVTSAPFALLSKELAPGATAKGTLTVSDKLTVGGTAAEPPAKLTIEDKTGLEANGQTVNLFSAGYEQSLVNGNRQLLLQQWQNQSGARQFIVGNGFVSGTSAPLPNDGPFTPFQALGFRDDGMGLFSKKAGDFYPSVFVDAAQSRVGIGTDAPADTLSVKGTFSVKDNQGNPTLAATDNLLKASVPMASENRIFVDNNEGEKVGFGKLIYNGTSDSSFLISPNEMGLLFVFGNAGGNTNARTNLYLIGSSAIYSSFQTIGASATGSAGDFNVNLTRVADLRTQISISPFGMGRYQVVWLRII